MNYSADFTLAASSEKITFSMESAVQLCVQQPGITYQATYKYNFLTRTLLYSLGASGSEPGVGMTPFAQLDPETLAFMYAKLVELGGKPPALPAGTQPSLIKKGPGA